MITCPRCTQQNDESDINCRACGLQLKGSVDDSNSSTGKRRLPIRLIVGLIGCAILFIYIAYRVNSALNGLP
jgi:uncharacterized membrane protein YvbJ